MKEIGTNSSVDGNSQISWQLPQLDQFKYATCTSICILPPDGRELNETDATSLILASIYELIRADGGGTPVLPRKLLDTVERNATTFFRQDRQSRLMVTSLSIQDYDGFPIRVLGSTITRADRSVFTFPRLLLESPSYVSSHIKDSRYDVICVETREATISQAFDQGITKVVTV